MFVFGPELPSLLIKYKLTLNFRCPVCTIYFANAADLAKHEGLYHAEEPGEILQRPIIGRRIRRDAVFDIELCPEDQDPDQNDDLDEGDPFHGDPKLTAEFNKFIKGIIDEHEKEQKKSKKVAVQTKPKRPMTYKKKYALDRYAQNMKRLMKPIKLRKDPAASNSRTSTSTKMTKITTPPPSLTPQGPVPDQKLSKRQQSLLEKKLTRLVKPIKLIKVPASSPSTSTSTSIKMAETGTTTPPPSLTPHAPVPLKLTKRQQSLLEKKLQLTTKAEDMSMSMPCLNPEVTVKTEIDPEKWMIHRLV